MDNGVIMAAQCPSCTELVRRDDNYCEACGQRLPGPPERPPVTRSMPVPDRRPPTRTPVGGAVLAPAPTCVSCHYHGIDSDGYCEQCGLAQPTGRARMACDLGAVAGVSDRGRVRDSNADAMAFGYHGDVRRPDHVVVVVCDGVGSGELSDQAAQDAADTGFGELLSCLADGLAPRKASVMAAARAYDAVSALSASDAPSTTYLSAVVTTSEITVAWLGDSRAYWLGYGGEASTPAADGDDVTASTCLTIDHTVRNTHLTDGIRAAHTLTRWLGSDATDVTPQLVTVRPAGAGAIVLCTDGLSGYLGEPGPLADRVLKQGNAARAAQSLVSAALAEGGRDNVTAVVTRFPCDGGWS